MEELSEIKSPCNGECVIDQELKFCQGCFRTMDEIMDWYHMDKEEKEKVLKKASDRMLSYLK